MILSVAVALFSTAMQAQDAEFVITGTAPSAAKWVYYFIDGNLRKPDSIAVNNGKFQLSGTKPLNTFVTLATDGLHMVTVVSDRIPITVNVENGTVTGSPQNVQFADFQKGRNKQTAKMMEIYKQFKAVAQDKTIEGQTKKATFEKQINELQEAQLKDVLKFAKRHKTSVTPAYFLNKSHYSLSIEQLEDILDNTAAYYTHPMMEAPKAQFTSLNKRRPGNQYTDLAMNDMQGKPAKLSKWVGKGKYVLVDFWASWCGPCRQEMPHVVDAYKRYHAAKGFDVVGVSFDSKAEAWKKGVSDLQLPWHNISDLKGWKCAAAEAYGINSIPSNILVDPQGKIVASDLRGAELAAKLKEIYSY